jgi:hypothetical protein
MSVDGKQQECPNGCGMMTLQDQSQDARFCAVCRTWVVAGVIKRSHSSDIDHSEVRAKGDKSRAEKLLALLFQGGAEIKITDGQLLIRPNELAQKMAPQIRELKSDLLILLQYCPTCLAELQIDHTAHGRHLWCNRSVGHYDRWEAIPGAKLKGLRNIADDKN